MNLFELNKARITSNMNDSYRTDDFEKALKTEEILKGKAAQIGEIRNWKDGKYRKTKDGWVPVKEGGGEKTSGSEDHLPEIYRGKKPSFKKISSDGLKDHVGSEDFAGFVLETILNNQGSLSFFHDVKAIQEMSGMKEDEFIKKVLIEYSKEIHDNKEAYGFSGEVDESVQDYLSDMKDDLVLSMKLPDQGFKPQADKEDGEKEKEHKKDFFYSTEDGKVTFDATTGQVSVDGKIVDRLEYDRDSSAFWSGTKAFDEAEDVLNHYSGENKKNKPNETAEFKSSRLEDQKAKMLKDIEDLDTLKEIFEKEIPKIKSALPKGTEINFDNALFNISGYSGEKYLTAYSKADLTKYSIKEVQLIAEKIKSVLGENVLLGNAGVSEKGFNFTVNLPK